MKSVIAERQAKEVIRLLETADKDNSGRLAYGEAARIERATGVPRQQIFNIRRGDSWQHIVEEMTT